MNRRKPAKSWASSIGIIITAFLLVFCIWLWQTYPTADPPTVASPSPQWQTATTTTTPSPTTAPEPSPTPSPTEQPTSTNSPQPTANPSPTEQPTATATPTLISFEHLGGVFHTIRPGDNLWDISIEYYEQPLLWPIVCEENGLDPCGLIHVDNELYMPEVQIVK